MPRKGRDRGLYPLDEWLRLRRELSYQEFSRMKQISWSCFLPVPYSLQKQRNSDPCITFDFTPDTRLLQQRVEDLDALRKFRKDVERWAQDTELALKIYAPSHKARRPYWEQEEFPLRDSIQSYVKNDDQFHAEPHRIGFRFARHGVHLQRGAGRGYGGNIGSRWFDRYGYIRSTDPRSLGKAGTGNRPERDWFNRTLDERLPFLEQIVSEYCADMTVNTARLYL